MTTLDRITIQTADSAATLQQAQTIRHEVFVVEQGIPAYLDQDGLDDTSIHALALDAEHPMATGRLTIDGDTATLSRIAVLPSHRRLGLGGRIVLYLEDLARRAGAKQAVLLPHEHLQHFYEKLGYTAEEGTTQAGTYTLITMTKPLTDETHPDP